MKCSSLILYFTIINILVACQDSMDAKIASLNESNSTTPTISQDETEDNQNDNNAPEVSIFDYDSSLHLKMDWSKKHQDSELWTQYVLMALEDVGADLVENTPEDIARFCPNFNSLNKKEKVWFWVYLVSVMTRFESSFKPETSYQEAFNDIHGNPIISRGLLQISIESGLGYGCTIPSAISLHDAEVNLYCGVRILNRWIGRDKVISKRVNNVWRGGARYWAVLRDSRNLVDKVLNKTRSFALCR